MTDQTNLADKLREIIAAHYAENEGDELKSDLLALLPEPPRPTLADMTTEERAASRWMQADTEGWGRVVITDLYPSGVRAGMIDQEGNMHYGDCTRVTPRPDLPRMEWPGNQKPSLDLPVGWRLADHPEHGRVIVTRATQGYVYFVYPNDALAGGGDWHYCDPAEMTYLDTPYIATTNRSSND